MQKRLPGWEAQVCNLGAQDTEVGKGLGLVIALISKSEEKGRGEEE